MLTKSQALDLLDKYAAEQPFKVATCFYVHAVEQTPECIVGHILVNDLNVRPAVFLETFEVSESFSRNYNGEPINGAYVWSRLHDEGVLMTVSARDVLAYVQDLQDGGEPWASAVELGREYVQSLPE